MPAQNNRIIFTYLKLASIPATNVRACRSFDNGATYSNPALAFALGTNEWYDLTENIFGATVYADYVADIPSGLYRLQSLNAGVWSTIGFQTGFYHSSVDIENHIDGSDVDMKHNAQDLKFAASATSIAATDVRTAIEEIAGAGWIYGADKTLKGHAADTTGAHAASAISCTVGALTDVESALDGHEARITALEAGTAAVPTNINIISGEIGMDCNWDYQTTDGVQYFVKFLWKHDYEPAPLIANLSHLSRTEAPLFNFNYGTRRFDIAINTDTNLVLYYAIGAWARGDGFTAGLPNIHWSAVLATGVVIPHYRQEQIITLSDVSLQQQYLTKDKDSVSIDNPEGFPTCTHETGGLPDDNYLEWINPFDDCTILGIALTSTDHPSATVTIKYVAQTGGVSGNFAVSAATGAGNTGATSITQTAGNYLRIWTMDAHSLGNYKLYIKFEV